MPNTRHFSAYDLSVDFKEFWWRQLWAMAVSDLCRLTSTSRNYKTAQREKTVLCTTLAKKTSPASMPVLKNGRELRSVCRSLFLMIRMRSPPCECRKIGVPDGQAERRCTCIPASPLFGQLRPALRSCEAAFACPSSPNIHLTQSTAWHPLATCQ